jgi:hypothetical protein
MVQLAYFSNEQILRLRTRLRILMRAGLAALIFVMGAAAAQAQGMFAPYYAPNPGAIALGSNSMNCNVAPLVR